MTTQTLCRRRFGWLLKFFSTSCAKVLLTFSWNWFYSRLKFGMDWCWLDVIRHSTSCWLQCHVLVTPELAVDKSSQNGWVFGSIVDFDWLNGCQTEPITRKLHRFNLIQQMFWNCMLCISKVEINPCRLWFDHRLLFSPTSWALPRFPWVYWCV